MTVMIMMKTKMAITQSIFKLEPQDFTWQQIQIILTDDDDDDNDINNYDTDHDDNNEKPKWP